MIRTSRAGRIAALALPLTLVGTALSAADFDEHDHGAGSVAASSAPAEAPTIAEDSLPLDPRFSPERIEADVAFLADDLLEGRDTASRGHEIAAQFAAQRFASLGLQPGGDLVDGKRQWFQQVTFQKTTPVPEAAEMVLTRPDGSTRAFKQVEEVGVSVEALDPDSSVTAPLVFVGYGLVDKTLGLDDYAGLDAKGKIVVALLGFPEGLPSEEAAYLVNSREQIAAEHGAVGMVMIPTDDYEKRRPWERSKQYIGRPSYSWVDPDGQVHVTVPEMRGEAYVSGEAAGDLFAGARRSFAQIRSEAARKGARPKGFDLPGTLKLANKATTERVTSPNVVSILPGSDPALKDEYIVLSGHLDHLGISPEKPGDEPGKDRINNGALDNAAGSAVTLEVARVFAEDARKPRRSLVFLLSTGEEKGLLGAGYYAQNPTVPADRIVADVDLDMPLLLYPFTDVIAFGADHSSLGRLAGQAVAPMGVTLAPDPFPQETIFVRSDHYEFVKQGVPAVFLATGYANGGEAQWQDFLANHYHKPNDDMAQAINWRAGARFAEANWRITSAMANADTPPLWYEGDYFGNVFAPGAPRAKPLGAAK